MSTFYVSPMAQTMKLEAGKIYRGYISVSNPRESESDFYYQANVGPYSVVDSDYTVDFDTMDESSEIVNWIQIENPTGVVKPNESKKIYFNIVVPDTAAAHGEYAVINVGADPNYASMNSTGILDSFEMASVIFAEVEGEMRHEGEVSDVSIGGFSTGGRVTSRLEFTNSGDVHETATVKDIIRNTISGEEIIVNGDEGEIYSEIIMPGTTRVLTRELGGMSGLGIYNVTEEVKYMGETSSYEQTVIVCPIWFIVLVLITMITLIGTIIAIVRKRLRFSKSDV